MKLFFFFVLTIFLLQVFVKASSIRNVNVSSASSSTVDNEGNAGVAPSEIKHHTKINCNHACSIRCSKALKRKRCNRACKSCCFRCQCVPPGTYGHTQVCPCYASLRTHGNRLKCP